MEKDSKTIENLVETVRRLRAPNGCPWDRAQDHQSLRPYLIEEAYEVLDVLDQVKNKDSLQNPEIKKDFVEELGDLLMQVVLHSQLANEERHFSFYDVADALNEKLIRRHPHVFAEGRASSPEEAFQNWEKQKAKEKVKSGKSILDGLPSNLPALMRSSRLIEKITKVGFQWSDLQGPLEKVSEELDELKSELSNKNVSPQAVENELGDLIFSLCNLAYLLKIQPEAALRGTLSRVETRFRFVENKLREKGKTPMDSNLEEMDALWNEAKKMAKKKEEQ